MGADFFASGTANLTTFTRDGYTNFQAVPPGSKGESNPLAGQIGFITTIPNAGADLVFSLPQGDPIEMRGGTHVIQARGTNYFQPVFVATSIAKR